MIIFLSLFPVLFFFIFYGFIFYSFIYRKQTLFFGTLSFFLLFYDYTFINLSYVLPAGVLYPLKSWMEYGFISLIIYGIYNVIISNLRIRLSFFHSSLLSIIVIAFIGVFASFIGNEAIGQIVTGFRLYILPFFLFSALGYIGMYENVKLKGVNQLLVLYALIIAISTILQYYFFNGKLSSLWFYDFFALDSDTNIDRSAYNFIRDSELRATGLYVSPLINSMVIGFFCLFAIANVLYRQKVSNKILHLGLLLLLIYSLWITNTRIGFFMLIIGLFCAMLYFFFKTQRFWLVISVPLIGIVLTFISLIFQFTTDLSALGRLTQYNEFLSYFKFLGLGLGNEKVITHYDSWYISTLLAFGVFSVFYVAIHYLLVRRLHISGNSMPLNPGVFSEDQRVLYFAIYAFSFSLVYIFAFQYTIGGPALLIFYFFNNLVYYNILCKKE